MKYSIDTSAFTFAWRDHYPPNIFPALWEDMAAIIDKGDLIASIEVYEELKKGGDDLFDWVGERTHMFIDYDAETQRVMREILRDYPKLVSDKSPTNVGADPHVIAVAKVHSCCVITREKLKPPEAKKIGIPNVCRELNIPYINFLDFLRERGWTYTRT